MTAQLIKTEEAYDRALAHLNEVFDAPAGTPEKAEAEILVLLINQYEDQHHVILPPDPIDAIRVRMEEKGIKQKDLVGLVGSKSRISEVLNRKKPLTLKMIRELHKLLQIPVAVLVQEYPLTGSQAA